MKGDLKRKRLASCPERAPQMKCWWDRWFQKKVWATRHGPKEGRNVRREHVSLMPVVLERCACEEAEFGPLAFFRCVDELDVRGLSSMDPHVSQLSLAPLVPSREMSSKIS
mmetsp:Transcript_14602/g.40131  ORF Transcript_14602/g.40131 Transcript_14602/m.40131 type:complete len:111 (+) Transcript_14602:184-516(+)